MKYISITIIFSIFIFLGCSGHQAPTKEPPTMKSLSFDFVSPTEGYAKYSGITFAIINPQYVSDFKQSNTDPYKTFAKNMGNDFAEMLTARGFQYKGPFNKHDEMVYNDKKFTDLVLEPEMDIQFSGDFLKYGKKYNVAKLDWVYEYFYNGNATMTAKLNLAISEPFTKTKVWVKSLQIEPITFKLQSYYSYENQHFSAENDPLVWNLLVDNLSKVYIDFLNTSWNHLDPEELLRKKDEANEIKQNSGFLKN